MFPGRLEFTLMAGLFGVRHLPKLKQWIKFNTINRGGQAKTAVKLATVLYLYASPVYILFPWIK